jgi:plastocyanin
MLRRALLVLAAAVALAGCASSASSPTPAPIATSPASVAPTPVPTPTPEVPLPAAGCPEKPEPTGTPCVTITIKDFAFVPPDVTVGSSARIVFVNEDGAPHSIAWADGTPTSPRLAQGDSTEREIQGAASGVLAYTCGIHGATMSGQIVVDANQPVP